MNLPKTTLIPEYLESGNSDFEIVKIEEGGETCKDIQSLPLVENIELYKSYIPANGKDWISLHVSPPSSILTIKNQF